MAGVTIDGQEQDRNLMNDATSGGDGEMRSVVSNAGSSTAEDKPDVPESVQKLVKKWNEKVNTAKEKTYAKDFKRARKCMEIAAKGHDEQWPEGHVTVPILNRHINTQVAALYAKDPKIRAKKKKRIMHTVWDGTQQQLQDAVQACMQAMQQQQQFAQAVQAQGLDPMDPRIQMMAPQGPDPQALAIVQDAFQTKNYNAQVDLMGRTMEALWDYFMTEQSTGYLEQFKAMVRRTKVAGWSWVKLGYQRIMQPRPEIAAQIDDYTQKLAHIRELIRDADEGEMEQDSPEAAELEYAIRDLQNVEEIIVREGPIFDFPRVTQVIVDPDVIHMKTLAGAQWICHEFDMSPEDVEEIFNIDLGGEYTGYSTKDDGSEKKYSNNGADTKNPKNCKVREIWDKKNQQVFTIVDGYCGFIKEPAEPDVKISRFFPFFPLVFNEIEHETMKFPFSDIWLARHAQYDYNRARQGLREHREQNRPFYVGPAGVLEEEDKQKFGAHESGEFIEIMGLQPGQKIKDVVAAFEPAPIDPKLYDVEAQYNDMLRTVGSQEANLGNPSGATATESSIAEDSRKSTIEDNVADLDMMLSALARSTSELMLLEVQKQTVIEIVGPGAVWPDMPQSRTDVQKELLLDVKGGSTGRPNVLREIAAMQQLWPMLQAVPNVNPTPVVQKLADLLNIDFEELLAMGLPAIAQLMNMPPVNIFGQAQGSLPPGGPQLALPAPQGGPGGGGMGNDPRMQGANGVGPGGGPPPQQPPSAEAQGQGQMFPQPGEMTMQ